MAEIVFEEKSSWLNEALTVMVGVVIGLAGFYFVGYAPMEKKLNTAVAQVEYCEAIADSLAKVVEEQVAHINDLGSQLTAKTSELEAIQSQLSAAQAQLAARSEGTESTTGGPSPLERLRSRFKKYGR